MGLRNADLREAIRESGVRQWELAEAVGIREETLSRKLRYELEPEEKEKLLRAVEQLKQREA